MNCPACARDVAPGHEVAWSCSDPGCGTWYHGADCPACGTPLDRRLRVVEGGAGRTALPPRVDSWRRRTATGAILTGVALGLQAALDAPPQPAAVVREVPGGPPPEPDPVEAVLDPDHPEASRLVVRSWLLAGDVDRTPR